MSKGRGVRKRKVRARWKGKRRRREGGGGKVEREGDNVMSSCVQSMYSAWLC